MGLSLSACAVCQLQAWIPFVDQPVHGFPAVCLPPLGVSGLSSGLHLLNTFKLSSSSVPRVSGLSPGFSLVKVFNPLSYIPKRTPWISFFLH